MTRALLFSVAALAACGGENHQATKCQTETRAIAYAPGMVQPGKGGLLKFQLVSSEPGPPAKGDNMWHLKVTDAAGQAVSGATLTVTPFMPDHGHGSPVAAQVTGPDAAGIYMANPVNLFMAGLWQVTVEAKGAKADSAVFPFCIDG